MNVLVIVAHPDDEVLGCGGTIARHVADGDLVDLAILGQGRQEGAEKRLGQIDQVMRLLGVSSLLQGPPEWPDNALDTIRFLDLVEWMERRIEICEPATIYTHHQGDLNIDHQLTARAVLTAVRPPTGVKRLYAMEVPSSTEWAYDASFVPDTFVDIYEHLATKKAAMRFYTEELREFPHPRSLAGIDALASWRGATAGMWAAEAFQLVRHYE